MRRVTSAIGAILVAGFCLHAHADDTNSKSDETQAYPSSPIGSGSPLTTWGISAQVLNKNNKCEVAISIDQPLFSSHISDMVDAQFFSEKVSPVMGNISPHILMNTFAEELSPVIVRSVFNESGVTKDCHFIWNYVNPDEYGNDKTYGILSFDFSKAISEKINWARFDAANLPKVSTHYKKDPEFSKFFYSEALSAMSGMRSDH